MIELKILEFLVANHLSEEKSRWSQYLTETQHKFLVRFLRDWKSWREFRDPSMMGGSCDLTVQESFTKSISSTKSNSSTGFKSRPNGAPSAALSISASNLADSRTAYQNLHHNHHHPNPHITMYHFLHFRVMAMIREQFIPYACGDTIFPLRWIRIDWDLIHRQLNGILATFSKQWKSSPEGMGSEESEEESEILQSVLNDWISNRIKSFENSDGQRIDHDDSVSLLDRDRDRDKEMDESPSSLANLSNMIIDDMYYTLEDDVEDSESEIKRIQMMLLNSAQTLDHVSSADTLLQGHSNGLGILDNHRLASLKYIMSEIDRKTSGKSNRELKSMLLEAKPSRSKWASDERIGQEELYEACEKVLADLKGYSDHSYPFLTKVNKRDAPDYYDVIKTPMDFGTITRNMKAYHYKSKDQFVKDLYLIYSNCLTYNTAEGSIYRVHAKAMQEKTDKLVPLIPNITIKIREDLEDESDAISSTFDDEDDKTESVIYSVTQNASVIGEQQSQLDEDAESFKGTEEDFDDVEDFAASEKPFLLEDKLIIPDARCQDLQESAYKLLVGEDRLKYLIQRYRLVSGNFNNNNQAFNLLQRTTFDMQRYREHYLELYKEPPLKSTDSSVITGKNIGYNEDHSYRYFLPEFMYITNSIPESILPNCFSPTEIPVPLISCSSNLVKPLTVTGAVPKFPAIVPSISAFRKGRPPGNSLKVFRDNIENIKDIISIRTKIHQLENNRDDSFLMDADSDHHEADILPEEQAPPLEINEDDYILNEECALHCLEKFSALFLMHSGFDGGSKVAVQILAEVFSQIFHTVARTIKYYHDHYGRSMSMEEIVGHALYQNENLTFDGISQYYETSIMRYGSILKEILGRLEAKFNEMAVAEESDPGDMSVCTEDFDNDDLALLSGNFGENLGIDILGLKDLGLPAYAVPDTLFDPNAKASKLISIHRKTRASKNDGTLDSAMEEDQRFQAKYENFSAMKFPAIKSAEGHIGLIQSAIQARITFVDDAGNVEVPEGILYKPNRTDRRWTKKTKVTSK